MKRFSANQLLSFLGLAMFLSEIMKQCLLTFVVGNGTYNFWYFPFQLCSIPMYCLLVYRFCKRKDIRNCILIFLADFSLLGGVFAFFDTSGMHYPIWILTAHSYLWHITMIVIGLTAGFMICSSLKPGHYLRSLILYIACAVLAVIINLVVTPFAEIDLFYINPRHPMVQVFFSEISVAWGNTFSICIYILACIAGGCIIHLLWVLAGRYKKKRGKECIERDC